MKNTVSRIIRDIISGRPGDIYFKAIEYMEIGNRTPGKFNFIISQISTVTIVATLLFGIDLRQYKRESVFAVCCWVVLLIITGYWYRRLGVQKKEDETNKDMSPIGKQTYDWLKEVHQSVCGKGKI